MTREPDANPTLEVQHLLRQPHHELRAHAERLGCDVPPQLPRDQLVAAIAGSELAAGGVVRSDGVLALLPEGYGFVRSIGCDYAPTAIDAYVSPSQVRSLQLADGQHLTGSLRAPRGSERFFALVHVERVDGDEPEHLAGRVPFAELTPVLATRPLALPDRGDDAWPVLRELAPWQRGHRVLLTAPPGWPTARFCGRIAAALSGAEPALQIALCLLEQRPEHAATVRAQVAAAAAGDVVATPFAAAPERHLAVAELALHRALRGVEAGRDVVLLCDSLTALVRAACRVTAHGGGWAAPGLPAAALLPAKRLFAAARQTAEGGSLTVIASVTRGGDSAFDDAVADEFVAAANSDVVVAPELASVDAAVPFDPLRTRTRAEDDTRPAAERTAWRRARNLLEELTAEERLAVWRRVLAEPPDGRSLATRLSAGC